MSIFKSFTEILSITPEEIAALYPFLVVREYFEADIQTTAPDDIIFYGEYDLPDGWKLLFLQMCEDIRKASTIAELQSLRIIQVKEKFGEIRCYISGGNPAIDTIIDNYSYLSGYICRSCGNIATVVSQSWISPWCNTCKRDIQDKMEPVIYEPIRKVTYHSADPKLSGTKEFNTGAIFNRYLKNLNQYIVYKNREYTDPPFLTYLQAKNQLNILKLCCKKRVCILYNKIQTR